MKGVLLISHGSRYQKTVSEIEQLVNSLKASLKGWLISYAFLEIAPPSIPKGLQDLADQGVDEILVLLNFLNSGRHVDQDIPEIVQKFQNENPGIFIKISNPVGQQEGIRDLFTQMIKGQS